MKNTRELISEELRAIRMRKKLSLEEVARNSMINENIISEYENNQVSMQIDILEKLLKYYDEDFDIFFKNIYANKQEINN